MCALSRVDVCFLCVLYFRIDVLVLYTGQNNVYVATEPSVFSCNSVCMCVFASLQIYRILGKTVVCYPIVFDLSDFYLSQDVMLLIDDIKVSRAHTHGAQPLAQKKLNN